MEREPIYPGMSKKRDSITEFDWKRFWERWDEYNRKHSKPNVCPHCGRGYDNEFIIN